jgi:hypothetical protein
MVGEIVADALVLGLVVDDGETVADGVGQRPASASVIETTVWPPVSAPPALNVVATVLPSEHANGPMLCSPEKDAPKA